jgi:hypothetical protein
MSTLAEISKKLESAENRIDRYKRENADLGARALHTGAIAAGTGLGALSTFLVGYAEQRIRTKDGAPLSIGPVSLPTVTGLVIGTTSGILGLVGMPLGATVTGNVASAQLGLARGTVGRGLGPNHRPAMNPGKKSTPRERQLAAASEDSSDDLDAALMRLVQQTG